MTEVVSLSAREAMRNVVVTVRIRGMCTLAFRLKIAKLLFRFAAFVAGTGIKIEHE